MLSAVWTNIVASYFPYLPDGMGQNFSDKLQYAQRTSPFANMPLVINQAFNYRALSRLLWILGKQMERNIINQ